MRDLRQAPVFTEDKIFLRNGADFSGTAYALDRTSGELLWEIPNIIGNVAYSPDQQLVYALREDGDLLRIDENTGNTSAIASFSPGPFIFFDGINPCAYQLAYNEGEHTLVVYLGDSRQLFTFKVE
jgi:outer membrane protein assembly factor BamB